MFKLENFINKLVEIYVNDDKYNFFVGYIIRYDSKFCLIKSIDKNGCFSSYELIKNSTISNIKIETAYLEIINKYIEISKDKGIYDKMSFDIINENILCDTELNNLLDCVLQKEFLEKRIIALCLKEDEDVYFGYINSMQEDYINLDPIESSSFQRYEKIKIFKSDIDSLQFRGLNLYLLNCIY